MAQVSKLACVLLVIGLAACGSPTKTTPLPTVQGQWQGGISSAADGVGTITLNLTQSGSTVMGAVVLSQPGLPDAPGTFTGTVSVTAGAGTLQYTTFYDYGDGCTGTYSGTLQVNGDALSGTYVGQNCAHPFNGTLQAQKRP